jgi:nucleoside-diphosphate-sugar epimerase
MTSSRTLVTGASGFIGGRVVERLALRGGTEVRAMIRDWSRAARVARFAVDVTVGDVTNLDDVQAAMRGVTHVVHCAYTDDPQVIVEGTRNLLTASLAAEVERFVFLSTAEVYGPDVNGTIDESTLATPSGRAYADAKIDAERLCRSFAQRGLPVTILRPSIVYGPYGKAWTVRIAKRLQSGQWGEFQEHGDGVCNAVYVDDLVSAILIASRHPAAVGDVFNINGSEVVTWNEYFRRFNEALRLPPLARKSAKRSALKTAAVDQASRIADWLLERFADKLMEIYLRGGMLSRIMARVKTVLQSTPTQHELGDLFSRPATYCDDKARRLLGYSPKFDLDRGVKLCALWLTNDGFVETKDHLDSVEFRAPAVPVQFEPSNVQLLEEATAARP